MVGLRSIFKQEFKHIPDGTPDFRGILKSKIPKDKIGLEIGPFFNPVCPKKEGYNCYSTDIYSHEELIERAKADPNISDSQVKQIEKVDFICDASNFKQKFKELSQEQSLDYIISSHNFEHLPNPIKFMQDCNDVLSDDGCLVFFIPYGPECFDMLRPLSTVGQVIDAYLKNDFRPRPGAVYDSHATFVHPENAMAQIISLEYYAKDALNRAKRSVSEYIGAHCWLFTLKSFIYCINELLALRLINFKILGGGKLGLEFCVILEKANSNADFSQAARECLQKEIRQELLTVWQGPVSKTSFSSIGGLSKRVVMQWAWSRFKQRLKKFLTKSV